MNYEKKKWLENLTFDGLYAKSNSGTTNENFDKSPNITELELEEILKEFRFTDKYKFSALKILHHFVANREKLNSVIENSFTFSFNKEKARRIVDL